MFSEMVWTGDESAYGWFYEEGVQYENEVKGKVLGNDSDMDQWSMSQGKGELSSEGVNALRGNAGTN